MKPLTRIPTHPGEILLKEWMKPKGITLYGLAAKMGTSRQRLHAIVKGRAAVAADMAWKLSRFFNTTPEFWMNLQTQHDLGVANPYRATRSTPRAAARRSPSRPSRGRGS